MQKKKDYFKIISIIQNTFYTYGATFQNTRKKMPLHQNPSLSNMIV